MSHHADAILDLESGPVPASAVPANHVTAQAAKEEKQATFGNQEVVISAAHELDQEDEPTDEEYRSLRKVPAAFPMVAVFMCIVELAERASYYGSTGCFANFVRGKLPVGGNGAGAVAPGAAGENQSSGALAMGSVAASATSSTFGFLAYFIPIFGGIIADTKWGRFKTIFVGVIVGFFAHVLLVIPAIPSVIAAGKIGGSTTAIAYIPFIISLLILAFAAGFIKPSLGPLLCDQSPVKRPTIKVLKSGERVILDPQTTVGRYLQIFYLCINIGAFFAVATSYAERFVGFWLAFLLPGLFYMLVPIVLVLAYKKLYKAPPQGSVVGEAMGVIKTIFRKNGLRALRGGDDVWNSAKPSVMEMRDGMVDRSVVVWDDIFVDEIRQSVAALQVFLLVPIFNLGDGGIGNAENDMSAAMTLNNIPNDVINNFNPLTIIIASPIITYGFYPLCERLRIPMKPMTRISIGFILCSLNMIAGAIMQWRVYETSPCGYFASTCDDVSPVNIGWQIILYAVPAIGEIFVNVTCYELAYSRAPARMKGLVYSGILFSSCISYAIQLALSKVIADPNLIWTYVALAVATFVCAIIFPVFFKHLNEPLRTFADPARQAGAHQYAANTKAQDPSAEEAEGDYKY